jgi:hypothetical protein
MTIAAEMRSLLAREDLDELMEPRDGPCVSILMPVHRRGSRDVEQDPIRLKNLLKKAEGELESAGLRSTKARDLLAPATALVGRRDFWEHQSDGLAVYLADGFQRVLRVPRAFEETVSVGERFVVKPLLPLLSGDGRFFVLAFSENRVRLLQGTRWSVADLTPDDLPKDRAEALWVDDPEKSLQLHTGTTSRGPGGGRRAAIFHGQGDPEDSEKTNLLRYFRRIDEGVRKALQGENAPLVLAGVEYLFPIYREANGYEHLLEEGVPGNPDEATAAQLHDAAWALVEPLFRARQDDARERWGAASGAGRALNDVESILPAAHHGRVDTLFVALGRTVWGSFDPEGEGTVTVRDEPRSGDVDLLDLAAAKVLRRSGVVYAVDAQEVPGGGDAAATLRY